MSFTEDEGEPPEEREEDYDSTFQFFSQFTRQLLLELPGPNDRTSAALWIQRLEKEPETEEEKRLRVDYLKLLLFVMQRGRLIGIFKNEPPSGPLSPFPDGLGLTEMGNFLLEQAELQGSGDADGRKVSYNVEISNDLREFVAAQEIPDFGIQVYYAWSAEDPIYKWMSFDETKFPQHVRDKIRQLKIVKSEEKTDMKSASLHGEKTDSLLRRSCDSTLYEKNRAKVKSPEEIEKSLERSRHSFSNYSSQRGSTKDKSLDDDKSWSPSRKSKNHSPDGMSLREMGTSRLCGQGSNTEETDDEDITAEMRRGRCCPAYSENVSIQKSGGCPHSNRKRDTETSKRLQKYDDAVANCSSQMNESSYMAGASERITDKCHSKETYPESLRCGGEAAPPQKAPCPGTRGFQMNQGMSQPPMKSRKGKYSAQGYQNQQEDPNKKFGCSSAMKVSSNQAKNPCTCPCPKAEKEIPCFKKKEKGQLEKTCSKSKPPCPESMSAKKPQEHPCPVIEERMKSCSRKMHAEPPEGCTCSEDRHKHQLENISRMGREKMINEMCPQEMAPQHQQYTCPRKKSDKREKRPTEQPEEPLPSFCYKNRPPNVEEMKRRTDTCPEFYTSQRSHQPVNASCCQQGMKIQDNRGPGRPCPGDYFANGLPPSPRNQDNETKMHGRPGKEGEYMDKRCEAEVKEIKHSPRQGQEYLPGNDFMPCANKRMSPNHNYPFPQEPPPRPNKMCTNMCMCGIQNQNREELCGNASSGSDENLVEDADGEDDYCVDQNNNPEEECPNDFNANEEGNAECALSTENVPGQNYDYFEPSEYPKLPPKIKPGFGVSDTPNKYSGPGCGPYPGAEQALPQQPAQAPFMTPITRQRYLDQDYTLPSRRKRAPDPRDFPTCNKLESPQYSRYIITSTPTKEAECQPFVHSPVSTIHQSQLSRCGQRDTDDDFIPLHEVNKANQGGRMYSSHKENVSGRQKKSSQDFQCSRGSPSQIQYMTLQGEDPSENQDMSRMMQCSRRYK